MAGMKRFVVIVVAIVILVVIAVLVAAPDTRRLTGAVRRTSPWDFVPLSEGLTEMELSGPKSGEPVILVHGMSVPMFDWDAQVPALSNRGYRVLRYNQYGRGLSHRPRGDYDLARYAGQLEEILASQGWDSAHIVAHSMGGIVAAAFAAEHPESVDSLILIAPALHMAEDNAGIAMVRLPILGDLLAKTALTGILAGRAEELFMAAELADVPRAMEAFRRQTRYRGFTRSVKSLFRGDVVGDMGGTYGRLGGLPVLLIHGSRDESIPEDHYARLTTLIPDMETVVLSDIGHMPNIEAADEVNRLIAGFLSN